MQFPTPQFFFLFLVVLAVTWAIRKQRTAQKLFLLGASYFFYANWDWRLLALIVGSSLIDWFIGERIVAGKTDTAKKGWLGLSLFTNLSMLGFFKYYDFFRGGLEGALGLVGAESGLPVLEVLLPLGISFYTFQCITYTVDLYRGYGVKAQTLLDFLLYIAFFPQLLIGPICRSRDLLTQLHRPAPDRIPDLSLAVSLIASGLFKKVVLATFLGTHLAGSAFISPENYSSVELLVAAYAYSIQLYLDFSGYTDMARGLGLLLGFHLPDNFNQPYRATSIADFWRRWHITFSNWLRDYIYLPLGGGWGKPWRVYMNLMITLLVAGIWHGAHWKFFIWGGIHGLALVAYKIVQDVRRARGINPKTLKFPAWYLFLGWAWTFNLCVFARIFFRTPDLDVAVMYWRGLFAFEPLGGGIEWMYFVVMALGMSLHFIGKELRDMFIRFHEATPSALRPVLWVGIAVFFIAMRPSDIAPFIYFAF